MNTIQGAAPRVLNSPSEMRAWRRDIAPGLRVGFVPTMGALHPGHGDLLRRMRANCDRLVLSIFVNPTQFAPNEDLSKYPRTLDSDLELARAHQVDAVFFPTPEQIYPHGYSTYVEENSLTGPLCGEFRPGHFRGVTTIVLKLFNLVRPQTAYFGLKDAQQFFVLHKMAHDLDLDLSVEGIPTVREADGLALSSRNRYLSLQERELAPAIQKTLLHAQERLLTTQQSLPAILQESRSGLEHLGFKVQYLECLELPHFSRPKRIEPQKPYLIAIAAHLGSTRLIDNVILRPERLAAHGIRVHT